ncbi:MAG TPA: hypothetical protein PKW75_12775 [candidate division Zixibacteria bacterium]|nr:hypothetical protein [candidate division Zixibacteria bacterium]MDD4918326.1 hypothetical protein [candidate division Zixibacteria bacterium]MDM7974032.1 hypothetical protein [candidate division Zixibacteria bacterium]HOD67454.1 hypothetical protein [candidate division Zixibacteria bacterium]HOZ09151.1 hypothetical protein [candidate division Zixibacteria bacterium]
MAVHSARSRVQEETIVGELLQLIIDSMPKDVAAAAGKSTVEVDRIEDARSPHRGRSFVY